VGDVAGPDGAEARRAAEQAARRSYGKLVAVLAARDRDVAGAEDALADAFAAALADWPQRGVPRSPEAWLLTVARRRSVDAARRRRHDDAAAEHLQWLAGLADAADADAVPDQRLALMFACAHPAIERGVRAPLMLQTLLGFDAATIASAFLVAPASMGQRLVRAKQKIREAGIPLRPPARGELSERLDAVLDAIYAAYAEGWCEPAEPLRRNLADEAIWLSRLVASLLPGEAEALGLLALMLHTHARRDARRDAAGAYVPLAEQDAARWDARAIDEAEALLRQAAACGAIGRYQLEAAVQSAHVAGRRGGRTDWTAIERLYDALVALTGSPVAGVNRAVAIGEARGRAAGLAALDAEAADARLADYQPYWAARAALLGNGDDAVRAYERAIGLERDPAVRGFLQQRQAACRPATASAVRGSRAWTAQRPIAESADADPGVRNDD
jgi:RNA polymerase sigma-70 factor (ECF subfamily)